uniref:non-ribosomal peptide synthetase n=9 Tax=Burkholderia pseudomallei TaxID=28450 RepID=UPI0021CC28A5
MNVNSLLDLLQRKNIRIHVDRDELVVRAPRGALNAELTQALKKSKAELIDVLRRRGAQASPDPVRITPAQLTLVALSQESIDALMTKVEGGAANVQDIYPLAPLQEGILFHHLMSGESDPYVLSGVLAFRGREVMERFVSALQQVIDRHDILRTGFFWEGLEQPVQVVQRRATLPVSVVELDAGEGDIVRQLEARFDSRGYRMDVSRAPLMHVHAACDGEHERWVARVLFHHLSIDHTTLERVIEEARAIGQGRVEDLPQPEPFRNFVAQARLGVSEADHEAYFRAKLGDIDEPTAPFGLLSVQGDGREIAEAARTLKPELSGALRGHARRLGVSAASMMHVAWGLVLSRTTGRQDVVFGTVLFGRMQGGAQSDRSLGLFINTLPVRMRVAQTGVEASVKGTHAQLAELMRHEHAPLVLAQRCSGVPAQTPLFTSLLNYRYSKPKVAAAHIADGIELLDGHERTNYPVSVDIDDHGDDFKMRAQAAASVDPARVCDFLEVALTRLVDALERDPHGALRQLDILPEVEREEVVRRWNAGEKARPSRLCLHELFERQAARAPDAIAVIQDERALTYAELNRCANRLAHYLRARGVREDDRVALYARRSPELLIGMLATLKAGGAYVPLDPGYPAERLTHMLLDSAPVVVLRDAAASDDVLVRLSAGTPILDLHADDERWSAQPSGNLKLCGSHEPDVGARRLAYVIYTSGSTGAPKGVMVEHASVVNQIGALTEYLELDASDRVLQFSNIAFDASVEEIFATLSCGATLVLRTDRWLADAETFWALCGAQRISIVDLPAQFFGQLALSGRRAVPTGVRCVVIGGEAVGASALDAWFAEAGRRPRLFNTYGPTETTVSVTVHEVRGRHDDANVIGRPIANTRVYVLDAWLRPAPIGVAGELYIGGVQVARGYLNRPELTRERFIDDPFVAGGRLYRTGDLARWRTDGRLEYLGRNDFQVKIRGFRIELGEIEAQLAKVAGVREVVVLARDSASAVHDSATENAAPDAPSPETATATEKRLVAYYTGDADVVALRAQAAQHLPSYMVPSAYVRLDAWPLTPNGKLDRRALPAPADDAYARAEYEAPQGAKEEALAAIWRELLHVERVSRHDNFFELGGHSLLAVQLVSRLRQALSVEVALGTVFDAPVLSALASRLDDNTAEVLPPIPLAPRDGRIALSLAQQRLWFLTQLEGVSEAYHMSGAVRLDGPLNREVLQRALNRIVMRHEALRTCFVREEGEPIQVIQPHADLTVSYHDLREAEQSEQRAKNLSQAHASAPFDLSRDLPVRVLLLQLADEAHVVQVVMHHIASDGWSVGVFLQELSALYGSFIAEQGDPLAPLPLQYADYAAWQRRWLASGQLEKQGAFWQTNLSGAPTLLELPTDRPRPPKQSHAGASVEVKLGVWAALCNGGCLSLAPGDAASDPQALLRWWRAQELDVGFLVTPLAELAYATGQSNAGMRTLLIGGDRLSRWPDSMPPGQMLVNNYGPTEATVVATSGRLQPGEATPPIGRPIANTRVYVLDAWLRPAPIGVAGELYIGGVQVARGYLNRPELTRERFIDDPFVAGGRLYKTGDLARWRTDGRLEYLGRNDFQVKIRGFRIELGEIEAQLAKVADVREVVVLARDSAAEVHDSATEHATPNAPSPSPETTTATAAATATATAIEKRLVAYYTGDADVVALRAQAAQHLPSYMVPSAYVRLDAWPLTPNGKLDRRALPAPADDAYARAEYEAPQGAKEEALAAIWRELLHVERVSRHDNFFELGGHSLLAVQLVSRLRQALSVEVALGTVFDAPVLSALAERLEAENTAVLPPIPLTPRDGRIALSLAQQRLWFLTQLEGVSEAYHMSGAVRLDGLLNREVLQRALNRIVMRHEALRTCFAREEGEPIQVIQPHADLTVSYHDLREAEQSEQRAKDLSQAHASAPFDLSRDLPVRVLLLQLEDEAHVVQVVMHHIASDGWSVGVFLQELSALYGSFIAEQGDPLAPLPLQYADYAAWQRRWLASGQLEKQGAFWQTNLSGAPTLLELPTDRPRPPKQSHAGASVEVKLGAALSERVKRLSQRHGVTPYMTLLSSWAAVLSRLSGQEEVVIGSPVAGRNRTEVETLIGFFVNTLALRLDLSSEPTVGELLKRTKAQVLSAQAHQDLPFDQVVERVKPPRSTAHPPLFQVMF